jgi:alpha-methylacyl-CoA racemase
LFEELVASQHRPEEWPALKKIVAARIAEHSQAHWMAVFAGSDACAVPVLDWQAAAAHPHNQARGTFVEVNGFVQAAPAPRFSRSGTRAPSAGAYLGEHTTEVLAELQAQSSAQVGA